MVEMWFILSLAVFPLVLFDLESSAQRLLFLNECSKRLLSSLFKHCNSFRIDVGYLVQMLNSHILPTNRWHYDIKFDVQS